MPEKYNRNAEQKQNYNKMQTRKRRRAKQVPCNLRIRTNPCRTNPDTTHQVQTKTIGFQQLNVSNQPHRRITVMDCNQKQTENIDKMIRDY